MNGPANLHSFDLNMRDGSEMVNSHVGDPKRHQRDWAKTSDSQSIGETRPMISEGSPSDPRPIFIVGAPRSGTTLLQYMLRAHPAISLPTGESHFIVPLYQAQHEYASLCEPSDIERLLLRMEKQSAEFLHTDLHGLRFNPKALAAEFAADGHRTVRDVIDALFSKNARGERKVRWGDKTPYYVLHIPKILDWWPNAQIIHLIRDGRDVALSVFERAHDFRIYNTYMAAKQWAHYVDVGRAFGAQLSPTQYLALRYEDILNDPRGAMQRICDFLQEPYSDLILDFKKPGGNKADSKSKTPLLAKPVQRDNHGKWRAVMSTHQVRTFEGAAGSTLDACGYRIVTGTSQIPLALRAAYRWHNALVKAWYQRFGPRKPVWSPNPTESTPQR